MTKIKKLTFESVNHLTSKQMKLIVGGSGAGGSGIGPCGQHCESSYDCGGACTNCLNHSCDNKALA